jgi:LPS sulfotransferase NodH
VSVLERAFERFQQVRCLLQSGNPPPVDLERVHIILADSRSGSTLLQEHLNCHPENTELGELFGQGRVVSRDGDPSRQAGFLKCMIARSSTPETGCKITFTQLIRNLEVVPFLSAFQRARFIFLERENTVAAAVSLVLARHTGSYHERGTKKRHAKVRIDPTELRMLIDSRNAYRDTAKRLLSHLDARMMITSYEELTSDTAGTVGRAFSFLGLSRIATASDLTKVAPSRLADAIENYEEVRAFFERLPEAKFLA